MPLTYILIGLNVAVSIWAFSVFKGRGRVSRFLFSPYQAVRGQNLEATLWSQFSHADPWHLFFNMLTLFIFGPVVENALGVHLLTVYALGAVAALGLIVVLKHNRPDYRVLGASGSVVAVLFAAIVLRPEMNITLFVVPIPVPAPLFAVLYLLYSTFLLDRGIGNVSHEAHIGGALAGLLTAGLLSPQGFGPALDRIHSLLH